LINDCKTGKIKCAQYCKDQGYLPTLNPTVTKITPTKIFKRFIKTKPPGWIGYKCLYCFGYKNSKDPLIRKHCEHGCLSNGVIPLSAVTVSTSTNKKSSTTITTPKTVAARKTKGHTATAQPKTDTKNKSKGVQSTIHFLSSIYTVKNGDTVSLGIPQNKNSSSGLKHTSYIWFLFGAVGVCIILILVFVFYSRIARHVKGSNNKIGVTDVVIHQPNYIGASVFVIDTNESIF